MNHKEQVLKTVLDGLMQRYRERVADVNAILDAMTAAGIINSAADIENDHIAFRTLGVPHLGIASLEKIFLALGYTKKDLYHFTQKKLDAYWYAPPRPDLPRIFISELRVNDLSAASAALIKKYTDTVTEDPVNALDLDNGAAIVTFLHSGLWQIPLLEDYLQLQEESEYASWAIYNRYYLNHFTISVHNLPEGYNTVAAFNKFLEQHGFKLNDSGGKVKVSPDGLLLQSSTIAQKVEAEFANGKTRMIPGSYIEFAERRPLARYAHLPAFAITREHRREGFEAGNADRIFESTYVGQRGV